jgi:ubiquinone/menaquinone biosynthesis C-methylase UbiE
MNARPNQLVVDVGGGRSCSFAALRRACSGTRIIAVDISEEEIRYNRDVDERRIGDVVNDLPFGDAEVDMIVSSSVLEHLKDLEAFVRTTARVLKPGGRTIHLLPSRYAPYALINRALPSRLSKRILYFLQPQVEGVCGFPAKYDRCYYSALVALFKSHGFEIEEVRLRYYQSRYFDFFVPAYLASVTYELFARATGARNLAAYLLIVARKER